MVDAARSCAEYQRFAYVPDVIQTQGSCDGAPGSALYGSNRQTRVGSEFQCFVGEVQVADDRMPDMLGAAAVEAHVVRGPSGTEG
jgi:hypothetical protein